MLLRIFYKHQWYTPFILLMGGVVLWRRALMDPSASLEYVGVNHAPLFELILPFLQQQAFVGVLIAFAMVMFQVFFATHLAASKVLENRFSALAGLIFLLLIGSRPYMLAPQPALFAGVFLILAFNKMLNTYDEKAMVLQVFNAGALISLAGLFYFPAWSFFILLLGSLSIYNISKLRYIMAAITGLMMPVFFLFIALWLTAQHEQAFLSFTQYQASWLDFSIPFTSADRRYMYVFALLTLISYLSIRLLHIPSKAIRIRKRMKTLNLAVLVALLSFFVAGEHLLVNHAMLVIPLSLTLAVFFEGQKRKKLAEVLFLLMVAALAAGHMFP